MRPASSSIALRPLLDAAAKVMSAGLACERVVINARFILESSIYCSKAPNLEGRTRRVTAFLVVRAPTVAPVGVRSTRAGERELTAWRMCRHVGDFLHQVGGFFTLDLCRVGTESAVRRKGVDQSELGAVESVGRCRHRLGEREGRQAPSEHAQKALFKAAFGRQASPSMRLSRSVPLGLAAPGNKNCCPVRRCRKSLRYQSGLE